MTQDGAASDCLTSIKQTIKTFITTLMKRTNTTGVWKTLKKLNELTMYHRLISFCGFFHIDYAMILASWFDMPSSSVLGCLLQSRSCNKLKEKHASRPKWLFRSNLNRIGLSVDKFPWTWVVSSRYDDNLLLLYVKENNSVAVVSNCTISNLEQAV